MNTAQALKSIRHDARKRSKDDAPPRGPDVEARKTWDSLYHGSPEFKSWATAEVTWRTERRGDAVDTAYAARQLEYVYAEATKVEFEHLPFADPGDPLIPWDTSVPAGAKTFVYYLSEASGTAVFLASMAGGEDLPSPTVSGAEVVGHVREIASQITVTVQQLRSAAYAGHNLQGDLGTADKRAHAEVINDVAAFGRADLGLPGFLNHPQIPRGVAAEKAAGGTSSHWSVATAGEMIADVLALVNGVLEDTHEIYRPDTIAMPARYIRRLSQKRLSEDGSGGDQTTVMQYLETALAKGGTPCTFRACEQLRASKSQGYLTTDAMIAYSRKPEHVALVVPFYYDLHTVQQDGMKLNTPSESALGGIAFRVPATAAMTTGLGAS